MADSDNPNQDPKKVKASLFGKCVLQHFSKMSKSNPFAANL